jgi:NACHT domain
VALAQAKVARSRLIGAGEPGDSPANVQFVRPSGRFREVGGNRSGDLASVLDYYQSLSPGRLVVLGEPGSGKTVLVLELQVRLLEARQHDVSLPVPVLVSAAACDMRMPWEEWLAGHLAERFAVSVDQAARLVRDGRVLPLVDGVDEMDQAGEPERAPMLLAALNAWMGGREKAPVVVTCRHGEYQALARGIDRATHIEMLGMNRFETESMALLPGQRVRARILGHHPWGVSAKIIGHEHVGASVDLIEQFGATLSPTEVEAMFPPIGVEIDAVVEQVRRWYPPAAVRLSIRPRDLELFTWPCDFCRAPVTLSAGGGGLVLDVRSNDGPGSHTIISHRTCFADRLHPDSTGERARTLKLGRQDGI